MRIGAAEMTGKNIDGTVYVPLRETVAAINAARKSITVAVPEMRVTWDAGAGEAGVTV